MDTTHPILNYKFLSDTKISCQDDPVVIKITGAANYQWNGGTQATNDTNTFVLPGNYTIKGTNLLGCSSEVTFNIDKMYFPPTPQITLKDSIITSSKCENYQWFRNGEILRNDTLQTLKISKSGTYFVSTNLKGCISTSEYISTTLNLSDKNVATTYSIFPNPMNTDYVYLHVKGAKENDELILYTITGKKINLNRMNAETIQTADLPVGVFILEIVSNNNIFRTKVIKE